jgi:HK97 family phage major capsid protein
MKKSDIKNRIQEIDNRLSELPTICEREQRELTEAETREMTQLAAERSDLQRQLADIERGETREVPKDKAPKFSLLASIRNIVNGGRFEGEYADQCREMAKRSGLEFGTDGPSILMKASAPEKRALDGILTAGNNFTSNSHNGGLEMVREDVLPIIEAIYNFTVLERAGANFYNGLVGNAKIPTMSRINFGFKAENAAADNVTPTMGKASLTPQRLTGKVIISKQLLNQTSEDLERRLRLNISRAIAQAFEMAVLGYGTSPHNGIMYNATGVTDAALSYDTVLALAESIYTGNMRPTFIVDPGAARLLKQKPRLTYGNSAIMADGMVDDEPTFITNSLVAAASGVKGAIACADFSRLHVGTWGDLLDITVDPYTLAGNGEIVLTLNYYCDWAWDAANGTAYAVNKITPASN